MGSKEEKNEASGGEVGEDKWVRVRLIQRTYSFRLFMYSVI